MDGGWVYGWVLCGDMCMFFLSTHSHLHVKCALIEDSSLHSKLPSCCHFTAELEENSALNSKVLDAAGLHVNGTFPLDYFTYNNSELLDVIFRHVQRTNFSGVTVSVGKNTEVDIVVVHSIIIITTKWSTVKNMLKSSRVLN